jgi:BRCT domain type II-containing protein
MEAMAIKAGASVTKSITNRTNILVIADPNSTSSKAEKARAAGIDLISPEKFFELCDLASTRPTTKPPNKEKKYSSRRRIKL